MWFGPALFFLIGVQIGSFLNVIILRGHQGRNPFGRSRCNACKKILGWRELVPVVSFLLQNGRCRSCGAVLSWQYPLVEFGTGVSFAAATWLYFFKFLNPLSFLTLFEFALLLLALSASIVIFVADLRWQVIPNGAVLVLLLVGILNLLIKAKPSTDVLGLAWHIGGALIFTLFLAALWFISRGRWMGLGDAKLVFPLALLVGFPASAVLLLFSFWLAGIVGIILLATGLGKLKSRIPFGPFLITGAALAYFFTPPFLYLFL